MENVLIRYKNILNLDMMFCFFAVWLKLFYNKFCIYSSSFECYEIIQADLSPLIYDYKVYSIIIKTSVEADF